MPEMTTVYRPRVDGGDVVVEKSIKKLLTLFVFGDNLFP